MKPSRNAPCPCGSGKKYKKCCGMHELDLPTSTRRILQDHFITESIPSSGALPEFSEGYFNNLDTSELTAAKLQYFCMSQPKVEELAATVSNRMLTRGKPEVKRIQNCSTTSELFEMMKTGIDPINHVLFRYRLLENPSEAIVLIISELQNPVTTEFVELALRIIPQAKIDVSNELIEIIEKRELTAYQLSSLCVLLGFYDNPKIPQLLWDHLNYFRSHFPQESYWRGPFYGLWEFWARNKFKGISKNIV